MTTGHPMKILVLGGNGMFGSMVAHILSQDPQYNVVQSIRPGAAQHAGMAQAKTYRCDVLNTDQLWDILLSERPDCIVNCTGLIKQRPEASDALNIFPINALFPHRLARMCKVIDARLIQFSTDCIFSGSTGNYADDAQSDTQDFYGMSKKIGEIGDQDHVLTLRTSIIGHEAYSSYQLIDWFLKQDGEVKGFQKAIFSGFPTAEIGRILADYVLPKPEISGIYNISADPISKYDLLNIVRDVYAKQINIVPDDKVMIDRSLNSDVLRRKLGYTPPPWTDLVSLLKMTCPTFGSKGTR